ncbi:MAG: Crp/Fnr family transcriptional regulator [Gemmatimonadota bacterium]|nr:MAG: Crp/Fnr family transcriptional regulator [Gemmatimonadota bacterium]
MTLDETLLRVPLFAHLSEPEIHRISQITRKKTYPKNSVIVFENDPGDALYVVDSGQVKVVLTGEDGREVILSVLGQGDFFGEMALIDDMPRSANVIAMENSRLIVLYRDDFHRCLEAQPRIALGLLRALSRRLRSADDKIGGLVLLDVPGRIARLLLQLADEGDGSKISRKITHHTIAQMVGSSRETVSRTIGNLTERGLISVTRKHIAIADRAGLEAAAGIR